MLDWTDDLPTASRLIQQGQQDGQHFGAQLFLQVGPKSSSARPLVISAATGEARPGVPLAERTLVSWLSSGKPVASVAIMQQRERGRLDLDEPVAATIPEFANNGKAAVTTRHLLTHTGGFRQVQTGAPEAEWDGMIAKICQVSLEPNWVPGQKAGYHPASSWYILGELIRRLDGRAYADYVRQEIFLPLGMTDCWVGMTEEAYDTYTTAIPTQLAELRHTNTAGQRLHRLANRSGFLHCSPGETTCGPAEQFARLYLMFREQGTLEGTTILSPQSVEEMITPQRRRMFDESFRQTIDWGLGLILDSKHYGQSSLPYGYGRHASGKTFGHSGNQSSAAFYDPHNDLAIALAFNGMPGERAHQQRVQAVLEAIYEDLQLAEHSPNTD